MFGFVENSNASKESRDDVTKEEALEILRQMRETYRSIMVKNPQYASSNEVDRMLWSHCFYNRISIYKSKITKVLNYDVKSDIYDMTYIS